MAKIELQTGDQVMWKSAAGELEGTIVGIVEGMNGKHQMIQWLRVERLVERRNGGGLMPHVSRHAYTDSNMAMLRFELIARFNCESCGATNPEFKVTEEKDLFRSKCCNDWIVDQDGNPRGLEGA